MRTLALLLVRFYQRWISPYKGFRCAYHALTGHRSCSHFGRRAFSMYGAGGGWIVLRRRLDRCAEASRRMRHGGGMARAQRGHCDLPCAGCDAAPVDACACDASACSLDSVPCCDCSGCDLFSRRQRSPRSSRGGEKYIRIPPGRWPEPDGRPRDNRQRPVADAGAIDGPVRPSPPPP